MNILSQNAVSPFDEKILNNLVFFTDLEHAIIKEDAPLVFLETDDYETVSKSMITLQKKHENININEWYPGIGEKKIHNSPVSNESSDDWSEDNIQGILPEKIDRIDDFSSDSSLYIRDLYNLLFSSTAEWNILVIKEFNTLQKDPNWGTYIAGWLRYFAILQMNRTDQKNKKSVVIVSKYVEIPQQVLSCAKKIIIEPPGTLELGYFVDKVVFGDNRLVCNKKDHEKLRNEIIAHLSGFSRTEINTILKSAIALGESSGYRVAQNVKTEKEKSIKRISALRLYHKDKSLKMGGLKNLSEHLKNVKIFLDKKEKFQKYELKTPRGILLVGMPGCGKSLTAKYAAEILERPLLQLEFGKILGKYVGESETNFLAALDSAEKSAPCVLWIDELEKAFAGMDDSTGVTKRLFGSFLTWMQESSADIYIVATANNISQLPPEFKRRGRFDKIFSLQMPSESERKEIFELKLGKFKEFADSVKNNCAEYADLTRFEKMQCPGNVREYSDENDKDRGCNGADIEAIVYDAFCNALAEDATSITDKHIKDAINAMKGHTQRHIMEGQDISSNTVNADGRKENYYQQTLKFLLSGGFESAQ